MADTTAVRVITARLEAGVKDLFESEKYIEYLKTMSRFHNYSARNIMLIHMQKPDATKVAGYNAWKNKFKRQVMRGEKGIKILAPAPIIIRQETEVIDPQTKKPVIDENGEPLREEMEIKTARFKVTSVFDVSQTIGEPLPVLAEALTGDVERYDLFMETLNKVSPLPIKFDNLPEDTDGTCTFGEGIKIREGMSEIQTVSAVIHEIAHAKLHDLDAIRLADENAKPKDRRTEEVEAESVSYAVCQYYQIETGANSFGYLAEWSKTRELKELNVSLDTIRKAAAELIDSIDEKYLELAKERGIDLSVDKPVKEHDDGNKEAIVPKSEHSLSVGRQLYDKLHDMFPDFMSGKYKELYLRSDGNMPLSLKWYSNGGNTLEVAQSYLQNDEPIYCPKLVFDIDYESTADSDFKVLTPVEYERGDPYLYQSYDADGRWLSYDEDDNTTAIFGLSASISEYSLKLFDEIAGQGYMPIEAVEMINGAETIIVFEPFDFPTDPDEVTRAASTKDQLMPDLSVTIADMNEYGYTDNQILPLTNERARELFSEGFQVYMIYPDNSEAIAFDDDEIKYHNDLCGVERSEWERSALYATQIISKNITQDGLEAELLYGNESKFGIYQIPDGIDRKRDFRFAGMDYLELKGITPDRANYELVYTAPLYNGEIIDNLNYIYNSYQGESVERPSDYNSRSPSVSDVIVIQRDGEVTSHFVDSFGFKELPSFTGEEKPTVVIPLQTTPTVAELKAEVDAGNSISLMDLSRAAHNERKTMAKSKPSLLGKLEQNKQRVAQQTQADKQKTEKLEVEK